MSRVSMTPFRLESPRARAVKQDAGGIEEAKRSSLLLSENLQVLKECVRSGLILLLQSNSQDGFHPRSIASSIHLGHCRYFFEFLTEFR